MSPSGKDRRPTLMIVDDDDDMVGFLRYHLQDDYQVVATAGDGRTAAQEATNLGPDLVLMDVGLPGLDGIEATRRISAKNPWTSVVMISAHQDLELVRKAMAAGAREYVTKPVLPLDLRETLARIVAEQAARRRAMEGRSFPPGAGIWAFTGPVGGAGQTTLLLSLANELLASGKRAVVVDAVSPFGDVALYLGLDHRPPTVAELAAAELPIAPELVERLLKHHPSGLQVLVGTGDPYRAVGLTGETLVAAVSALAGTNDYVLVDMPAGLPDRYLPLLDEARFVFASARADLVSVKNLRIFVRLLAQLGYPPEKTRVALLCHQEGHTPLGEFEKALAAVGSRVDHVLPADPEAARTAMLSGEALARIAPKSPYTRAVRTMLAPILQIEAPTPRTPSREGLLQRLFGMVSPVAGEG